MLAIANERDKLGFFDEGHWILMVPQSLNEATKTGEPGSLD